MIFALNPSDSITAVLSAAITTTNPTYSVRWREGDQNAQAVNNPVGSLTADTALTLVSAPSSGQRFVDAISIYNVDTAAVTVTISKVVSGTSYAFTKITLAVGDTLNIDAGGIVTVNTSGNEPDSDTIGLLDAVDLSFGDSADTIMRWSTGDASDHSFVVGLGDTSQMLHITDKAAVASDWAITSPTHPTVYIHSNTTPITDYLSIGGHTGSAADINLVGAATLNFKIDGTAEVLMTASILDLASTNLQMQDSGQILDNSGLELIKFPAAVASAVNEFTVTNSATGDPVDLSATGDDTNINLRLTPKGAGFNLSNGPFQIRSSTAVTATVGGGTTGLIPAGATNVIVTSDNADKQISLPAASVGDEIWILVGATGCELISAVAAHKVNDVTVGATNEAALTATNLYWCKYVATNTWVVLGYTKLGAVQAPLVPDSL